MNQDLLKIKVAFKKLLKSVNDFNNMEEINEIVKLFSVSLFLYNRKYDLKELIEKEHDFIMLHLIAKLSSYEKEIWVFQKDKNSVLKRILLDGNWSNSEFLLDIFDLIDVDDKILITLKRILRQRKFILNEMKWE